MHSNGTTGTKGHLNGLVRSGLVCLSMITPAATMMNAARVPTFTSCAISWSGRNPAINAVTIPTKIVTRTGVRKFRVDLSEYRRKKTITGHGKKNT